MPVKHQPNDKPTDRPNTDTFYAAQQQARAIDLYLFRRLYGVHKTGSWNANVLVSII